MAPPVQYITVPWVPLADFDWSFARSGPLPWNLTVWSLLAVFTALPIWTTVTLTCTIFHTFRRYTGLYFYSVLACTWGVTIHAIGFILKFCVPSCNWIVSTVLAEIGWVGMVTGFSVVLYSRLGLIVQSVRVRRYVLLMVIVDAFLFHVPTIVFQFGVSNKPSHTKYLPYMAPMERVQIMGFSIQEVIISAIYIHATLQYLRVSEAFTKQTRRTIGLLAGIQILVILADVVVITLDYCEYFTLKAVLHSFVYGVKLQVEFVILNDVKAMSQRGGLTASNIGRVNFDISPAGSVGLPKSMHNDEEHNATNWWSSSSGVRLPSSRGEAPSLTTASDARNPASSANMNEEKKPIVATPTSLPDLCMSASSIDSSDTETMERAREREVDGHNAARRAWGNLV